jgi:hypothetical protein
MLRALFVLLPSVSSSDPWKRQSLVFLLHCAFSDLFLIARPFAGLYFPIFSRHRDRRLPAF